MKNIAINTLNYVGKITISKWIGSKKIVVGQTHNSGGQPLFDFFVHCFMEEFSAARAKLPRKIGLYTENGGVITGVYKGSLLTAPQKTADSGAVVRFSFSIPSDIISSISSFKNAYIGLYPEIPINQNNPYEDCLASFSLKDLKKSLFLNSALVVDWDLQIVNASGGQDESTSNT